VQLSTVQKKPAPPSGDGQVHPTARSRLTCHPNVNAI
jgi:hypothetical protein